MKLYIKTISVLASFTILTACATKKAQYKVESSGQVTFPDKEVETTFYLIGDGGLVYDNEASNGIKAFQTFIKNKQTKGDYVLFLGDNIYPAGMPEKEEKGRAKAEQSLKVQLQSVEGFQGKAIFIPGNHDWYANRLVGLKEEEKFIENTLGKDSFLPENGCPLESIDVSDKVQLVIVDTQWYLENWNKNPTINDDCEIKTEERFFDELEGEIKKGQGKTVVVAMHHPMFTNGSHGGQFAAAKHLFPTQKPIPLPGLASLVVQLRAQGGVSPQDRYNKRYNELMQRIETMSVNNGKIVFVSGHEHTLQYIEHEGIKQIVSGAGSKDSYAALGDDGLFSYGKQGFAEYTVYKDGSSFVSFYSVENGMPKLLYQKEVYESYKPFDVSDLEEHFPQTLDVSIYSDEETDRSKSFETFWGKHYRDLYSTKIKARVATLDTLYGGLEIVRKGGGHQTRSLRLKTKDGQQFNMRALRKSATQYLQAVLFKDIYIENDFKQTEVEELILDFYTAAHPYVFEIIPELSKAAKVYHTEPELYYIPKHKYLGDFNDEYGDELYLIEERPEENQAYKQNFGYADDIESSHDIIAKIRKDEKYKIDEEAYIRARLFDMLIGDWDRHQDQWRWAQFNQENGDKLYRPIPRDRDQAFSNFDGGLLTLLKKISNPVKQLQVYDAELKDIKWVNNAGIRLDRVLIRNAKEDLWLEQAEFLQKNITNEVIEKAFESVPNEVKNEQLQDIKSKLIGRRGNLKDIAGRYYKYLNELVVITATDKDDYIEVQRTEKGKTRVVISRIKKGEKGEVLVDRTFDRDITKELWIYGLDDKDVFEVSGDGKHEILTRLIGGQNNDTYIVRNGKGIKVYDHKSKKNTAEENKGAGINFTDIYNLNLFDFEKGITKTNLIAPGMGYNPDDGMKLGVSFTRTTKGFKRNPFSTQHRFRGGYYFATEGYDIRYNGEFANVFGEWNLAVGGVFASENFTNNFFGYGNETKNIDDDLGLDYNRVKTGIYGFDIGLLKTTNYGSAFGTKLMFEGIEIQDTPNRFISEFEPLINIDFYERRFFVGAEVNYNYKSFDKKLNPSRGMTFLTEVGGKTELKESTFTYGYINSSLGFYNALSVNKKWVLKTDVRTQLRFGDDLIFYQAANIGGENGFRGYRTQRFTGRNSFIGSADLRYSFKSFKTAFVPLQIGVFGGGDVGRVWLRGDDSDKWHNDYGGGFWVAAAETVSATFNLFNGEDGMRFSFGFGMKF
ncbi:metallophosphoesterase [Aestuariibaculum suncheonense]|uniref:Metallophosphoesterase n=1 Tax=Aestuariibaculum suncheonense TaxID=1028745 RepID=A0A8J6Q4N8_9FLAO|nr:metallophosphoesterase [Aestuariibaculum suncheonense]MBD0834221.1 metallophosphoesterase [Aestuariibaculum suncheonense]